jgi:hypothetical protein
MMNINRNFVASMNTIVVNQWFVPMHSYLNLHCLSTTVKQKRDTVIRTGIYQSGRKVY